MANQFSIYLLLTLSLFLLPFSACKKSEPQAAEMSDSVAAYVYAYTSGAISKASAIKVNFTRSIIDEGDINTENSIDLASEAISFRPNIEGTATWENGQTLVFTPSENLTSGQVYVATVNLKKLIPEVPSDATYFEFDFRIKEQNMVLQVDGIRPETSNNLKIQEVYGTINTIDVATNEEVEQSFAAQQNSKTLKVSWQHSENGMQHEFVVEGVDRSNAASEVQLSLNGASLGVTTTEEKVVEIPALGDFKVVNTQVKMREEQRIILTFSDPLLKDQNVDGLIQLSANRRRLKYTIEGNQLIVYPTGRLTNTQKITVAAGIKNIMGAKMENPIEWTVTFESIKPQVRLVGNGVIMPNSDGLVFPFEAVSLNAVEVEIFKIFNNNVLQFLQRNNLNGYYNLEQVGRVVLQEKVLLKTLNAEANYGEWTRYALDLNKLMQADPNALYQVRIGFRQSYIEYICEGVDTENNTTINTVLNNDDEINSIWDNYYGLSGYYEDYEWEHREDPCKGAYYNDENFVRSNVVASNLGIIAKMGRNKEVFIAISDLRTTKPVSAQLEFYDYQQQLIKTITSDSDGIARTKLSREPFVVLATQGDDRGYLKLKDGNALSVSRFDVAGAQPQAGLKGFIYGERGVWRPGDSIYLNFILEDESKRLPNNHPITFELYDARGQLFTKRVSSENIENIYPLAIATNTSSPTGNWQAKVQVGGAIFSKTLKVETVKPNRLKINLDFGKDQLNGTQEPLTGDLQVNWLHGAPAKDLAAKVEVQVSAINTTYKKYPEFEFDDPARSIDAEPRVIFDDLVNSSGNAKISTTIYNGDNAPGKLKAAFKTRAFEKGGDFSTDNFTLNYSPYPSYTGVKIPRNQYQQKRLEVGSTEQLEFVVVDEEGSPLANQNLSVGLYRLEWRWWWDRNNGNIARYNSSNHFDALETSNVTTNSQGQANWGVEIEDWGRYLVRVCNKETGHCSGDFFYAGRPYYEDGAVDRSEAAMMYFTSNKEKYQVGEDIELTVPAGDVGRVLITLENGTEVLESRWADAKKGDNKYRFYTTKAMTPTIYAHVALMQPHAQVKNDLPIRMYGVIPIVVEDQSTILQPTLAMPEELKPEQKITVKVGENNGQAMAYTLAMVDDGLLDLTRFQTPDPHGVFYAREGLGVKTWDVYDDVLGAYGGELERILSVGGDGEVQPGDADKSANRFEPVVKHLGPFYLEKGATANHEITIPNYVGSVRTMVVAANRDGAYGHADKTTPVRKPLMILPTLPRVLGPGETLTLPVNVFAMDKKIKEVQIKVEESSGLVSLINGAQKSLRFAKMGDQLAEFALKIAEDIGIAKFKITATGGGETTSQEIEIDIRNPNPVITDVFAEVLEAGEQWSTNFSAVGMRGTNEGVLEVSNIPPINLGKRLDYLLRYPYGCVEQTTSSAFPQLYVDQLLELNDKQKQEIPRNIQAAINRLKTFQNSDGGLTYWPGGNYVNQWGNNYAGHFLLEAKNLGYTVPNNLIEGWKKFQKKTAQMWTPDLQRYGYSSSYEDHTQAYRLYTLALANAGELGAMNRLREKKKLSTQARWRLAAAYAVMGKIEVAKELTANAGVDIEDYQELSYTFGSQLRDRAMVLETLVLMGNKKRAAEMVQDIAKSLSSERWLSTQETAYSLLAIGKFVGNRPTDSKLTFAYQMGGNTKVNAGSETPMMQVNIPVDQLNNRSLSLTNTTPSILFARLLLSGKPATGEETDAANNLKLAVSYTDMEGDVIDISNLSQGTDFIAEVTVTHSGKRLINFEEMALIQIFPSGWEIINARMDDFENAVASDRPEYQDFRDDRVYTHFDIPQNKSQTYRIQLNAAYQGRFYLPAVNCEAMYDHSINARKSGQWIQVVSSEEI